MISLSKKEEDIDGNTETIINLLNNMEMGDREAKLGKHYKINFSKKIGVGGFGQVYEGTNMLTNEKMAIKVESIKTNSGTIKHEARIINRIQGGKGIPRLINYIEEKGSQFLLIEMLGPSLNDLFDSCNKKVSLKTVLTLGYQMINRLEFIHSKGVVHLDIKPENFLFGIESKKHTLYLIDYGLSQKYIERKRHVDYKRVRLFNGTERFCSLNALIGYTQSRRDDLESMMFVILYLLNGTLPWMGLLAKTKKEKIEKIKEQKANLSQELLSCQYDELWDMLVYSRTLEFTENPDYQYLKNKVIQLIDKNKIYIDNVFEWEK